MGSHGVHRDRHERASLAEKLFDLLILIRSVSWVAQRCRSLAEQIGSPAREFTAVQSKPRCMHFLVNKHTFRAAGGATLGQNRTQRGQACGGNGRSPPFASGPPPMEAANVSTQKRAVGRQKPMRDDAGCVLRRTSARRACTGRMRSGSRPGSWRDPDQPVPSRRRDRFYERRSSL